MRTIERSTAFKRDYKRETKGRYQQRIAASLTSVLITLANDQPLDLRFRDHQLSGDWPTYRECHLQPDLLLIYRKTEDNVLRIARLGSHSELFG